MEYKVCTKCKIEKDVVNFCKDSRSKDKRQSVCKTCKNEAIKLYYKNNPHKRHNKTKEQNLKKYYNNKINMNFSRRLRQSLIKGIKNNVSWEKLVGYNLCDLKQHLESKFADGMSWQNYGEWHIDHIKPISSFNIKGIDEEFKKCWSLDNLQPLWAKDNLTKSNKYAPMV